MKNTDEYGNGFGLSNFVENSAISTVQVRSTNCFEVPEKSVGEVSLGTQAFKEEMRVTLKAEGGSSERRRFQIYIDAWERSNLPDPNFFLTINFSKEELDVHCQDGQTVSSYFSKLFGIVRKHYERSQQELFHIWAAEVKDGKYHIHCILHLPNWDLGRRLMKGLLKRLNKLKGKISVQTERLFGIKNSGLPVHGVWIDPTKSYSATGKSGLEGLQSYLAKSICFTASRKKGFPIGKTVGASTSITRLTKNVHVHGRHQISYTLSE